jgi:MoaA/NifB/PqqE/SkfB family radical SAM enzyme
LKLSVALRGLRYGSSYLLSAALGGRRPPLVGGLALTDTCNLRCKHCSVGRNAVPEMTFEEVRSALVRLKSMGMPVLYLEGGEPFLWRSGGKVLEDVVALSRQLGFLYTIVYSNGTFPIHTSADAVFVSMDGLRAAHDALRGRTYDKILSNILASRHPRILINYTINRHNEADIEEFSYQLPKIANVRGTFFYFYTPDGTQPEVDRELYLELPERRKVVDRIIALKQAGRRILNSTAALRLAVGDGWKKPDSLGYLWAEGRMYECCRHVGKPALCESCGYLGFAELFLLSRFDANAITSAVGYL